MKKLAVLLAMLLALCGCADSAGGVIRYDLPAGIQNLDPQFATDAAARMVISNSFDGLYRQLPTGEVIPCLAKTHTVSADGLTHTFQLEQGHIWQKAPTEKGDWTSASSRWADPQGVAVTAHDFSFALRRLFGPHVQSPYAKEFSSIRGAQALLEGRGSLPALGVRALDDYTLEITLDRPDARLTELLASPAAMPCHEAFFLSTRARYGMELQSLNCNGPYAVSGWSSQLVAMRQNPQYSALDESSCAGADFYIPTGENFSPIDRFLAGDTDACRLEYAHLEHARGMGSEISSFEDTVWVLALNPQALGFTGSSLPRAIAHTINHELFTPYLTENLRAAHTLVPPAVAVGGQPFRTFAGEHNSSICYDPTLAKESYQQGLAENGLSKLKIPKLLICDEGNQALLAGCVQRGLQELSIYTSLERATREELLSRVAAGEFEAAILPLSASYSSPEALFSYFRSGAALSFTGYENPDFDALLDSVEQSDPAQAYAIYAQAERMLLEDGAVVPLYFETTYYAAAEGVAGVSFSPFLSGIYFRDAHKN